MSVLDEFLDIPGAQSFGHYVCLVCPWHESYPVRTSLFVYKDFFICKSCGAKGSNHDYLLKALHSGSTTHFELKKFSNPWNDWIRDYGSVFGVCKQGYQSLQNFPQQKYYLQKRGIPEEKIQELKLGYLSGFYIIPFLGQSGDLLGAVARAGEGLKEAPKYTVPSGQDRNTLYVPSWDLVNRSETLYVTYGIIDAISLTVLGLAAISTTAGQSAKAEPFEKFRKKIVIVPDLFEEETAYKLADNLGWRGSVKMLDFPTNCKDVNDMYLQDRELLKRSLNVPTEIV